MGANHLGAWAQKPEGIEFPQEKVGPLIQTLWGEGRPLNEEIGYSLCGKNYDVKTGSLPVAMAQVMNYWQWPQGSIDALFSYTDIAGKTHNNYPFNNVVINWENIASWGDASADAQFLAEACALAAASQFSTTETNTNFPRALAAMVDAFGFSRGVRLEAPLSCGDMNFQYALLGELAAGRPVICKGAGLDNREQAFIVDGYDPSSLQWHINFCNGEAEWCDMLPDDIPAQYPKIIDSQYAMIGLCPPGEGVADEYPAAKPIMLRPATVSGYDEDNERLTIDTMVRSNTAEPTVAYDFALTIFEPNWPNYPVAVVPASYRDEFTITAEITYLTFYTTGMTLPNGDFHAQICWRRVPSGAHAAATAPSLTATADGWEPLQAALQSAIELTIKNGKISSAKTKLNPDYDITTLLPVAADAVAPSSTEVPEYYTLTGQPLHAPSASAPCIERRGSHTRLIFPR